MFYYFHEFSLLQGSECTNKINELNVFVWFGFFLFSTVQINTSLVKCLIVEAVTVKRHLGYTKRQCNATFVVTGL